MGDQVGPVIIEAISIPGVGNACFLTLADVVQQYVVYFTNIFIIYKFKRVMEM